MLDHNPETEPEAMVLASEELSTVEAMPTTATEAVTAPEADQVLPCGCTQAQHDEGLEGIATRMLNLAADLRDFNAQEQEWSPEIVTRAAAWTRNERAVVSQLAEAFTTLVDGDLRETMLALSDKGHEKAAVILAMLAQKAQHDPLGRVLLEATLSAMDGDELMAFISLILVGADRMRLSTEDIRKLRTAWHD